MKAVLRTQLLLGALYRVRHTIFLCVILAGGMPMVFSQGTGIGGTVGGYGGNPVPEYCREPCNQLLSRWFEIIITAPPTEFVDVVEFEFHEFYFHQHTDDFSILAQNANILPVASNTLMETWGAYPNGTPHHGMEVGGVFHDFFSGIPRIPAGGTGRMILWLDLYGCSTPGATMPDGYYTITFSVHTGTHGVYHGYLLPAKTCGNWNDDRTVAEVVFEAKTGPSLQAFPNPVKDKTLFTLNLPEEGICSLELINIQGQKVMSLIENQEFPAGTHQRSFPIGSLPSGVYFARLETPNGTKTTRIIKH